LHVARVLFATVQVNAGTLVMAYEMSKSQRPFRMWALLGPGAPPAGFSASSVSSQSSTPSYASAALTGAFFTDLRDTLTQLREDIARREDMARHHTQPPPTPQPPKAHHAAASPAKRKASISERLGFGAPTLTQPLPPTATRRGSTVSSVGEGCGCSRGGGG